MPTGESGILKREVISRLKQAFPGVIQLRGRPTILSVGDRKIYLRVTTTKAGPKYWFDVKPNLYERRMVDFFVYACGSPQSIYVFPVDVFARMIAGASKGGVNQVPNFTIFVDSHEFEPAGQSDKRHDISKYFNSCTPIILEDEPGKNADHTESAKVKDNQLPHDMSDLTLEEGTSIGYHRRIERNPRLAEDAKAVHGCDCQVCGFNYEKVYGEIGRGYIEAHHLTPLAELAPNGPVRLSPKDDFAVVCSNCHSMIHRTRHQTHCLAELREIVQRMRAEAVRPA
jgi:hypothetical protein